MSILNQNSKIALAAASLHAFNKSGAMSMAGALYILGLYIKKGGKDI